MKLPILLKETIFLLALLSASLLIAMPAYADEITLKLYNSEHPLVKSMFIAPDIIEIYIKDIEIGSDLYMQLVSHELTHYYCLQLFGDIDYSHKRCFAE